MGIVAIKHRHARAHVPAVWNMFAITRGPSKCETDFHGKENTNPGKMLSGKRGLVHRIHVKCGICFDDCDSVLHWELQMCTDC